MASGSTSASGDAALVNSRDMPELEPFFGEVRRSCLRRMMGCLGRMVGCLGRSLRQKPRVEPILANPRQPAVAGGGLGRIKLMFAPFGRSLRQKIIVFSRLLSFDDNLSATWLGFMSHSAVMGIGALNIYSASYFLAWTKDGSLCSFLSYSNNSSTSGSANSLGEVISNQTSTNWIKSVVVALPFVGLAFSLCIGSLAETAKQAPFLLGFSASMVLSEVVYIVVLGGVMMICMSHLSGAIVSTVCFAILAMLLLLWGCCCRYPKCLRNAVLCKCCCTDIDEIVLEVDEETS